MQPVDPRTLTINGGSSSIKFALFEGDDLRRVVEGTISRIGLSEATLRVEGANPADNESQPLSVPDYDAAVNALMDWVGSHSWCDRLTAVGHRVVHGGPKYTEPLRISVEVVEELRQFSPFDPEHMPQELLLIEALQQRFPGLPQVACFDTAFHQDLPPVARTLPIPRRYQAEGIRRYGFHGLSFAYLLEEFERKAGVDAAQGRLVLAHLGSGASMAAVRGGRCVDTTMGLTPAAGLVMGTRTGDIDPGVLIYLARAEGLSADQLEDLVTHDSGLLGVSETSSDMRDLLDRQASDPRAAEAIELFCYQARKWVGALAAALGGLDALVFSGGIGENAPEIRARVCDGLDFLGVRLDPVANAVNASQISTATGTVAVRVIPADEELMIAKMASRVLKVGRKMEDL